MRNTILKCNLHFLLEKDPVPIRCPVAGAFNFTQTGDFLFRTRILGGITKDPRHDVWGRTGQFSCKQNISRLAVCDTDQKEITIDETYCWSTDHRGRPIDIYSDPDYRYTFKKKFKKLNEIIYALTPQDAMHWLLERKLEILFNHL